MYVTFLITVVSLANRLVDFYGMLQPRGIFVFPATFLICDIVCEVFGYAIARQFIWIGVISEALFAIVTTTVVHMPPPTFFKTALSYQVVFDPTIRFVFSSLCGLLFGEFINIYLLAKWKIRLNGRYFCIRTIVATAVGQLSLSIIVDVLAFSGSLTVKQLLLLILSGFLWKMVFTLLFMYPARYIMQKIKPIKANTYYDIETNFNPFRL